MLKLGIVFLLGGRRDRIVQWLPRSLYTREIPSSILGTVIFRLLFILLLIWICTNLLGYVFSTRNHLLVLFF